MKILIYFLATLFSCTIAIDSSQAGQAEPCSDFSVIKIAAASKSDLGALSDVVRERGNELYVNTKDVDIRYLGDNAVEIKKKKKKKKKKSGKDKSDLDNTTVGKAECSCSGESCRIVTQGESIICRGADCCQMSVTILKDGTNTT